jgi:hypothetical protein
VDDFILRYQRAGIFARKITIDIPSVIDTTTIFLVAVSNLLEILEARFGDPSFSLIIFDNIATAGEFHPYEFEVGCCLLRRMPRTRVIGVTYSVDSFRIVADLLNVPADLHSVLQCQTIVAQYPTVAVKSCGPETGLEGNSAIRQGACGNSRWVFVERRTNVDFGDCKKQLLAGGALSFDGISLP